MASISQGAMAAALTVGSTLQSVGQSVGQAVAASVPTVVAGGAAGSAQVASGLALAERPARAVATAIPKSTWLTRGASFLSKALPIVTIGAGVLAGAKLVDDQGVQALMTTRDGRGAVLSTMGGVLLLVPTPATQLAAAGMLAGVAVNQLGGFDRLDDATRGATAIAPTRMLV